jgi:serine/threonine-protein kinase HipA
MRKAIVNVHGIKAGYLIENEIGTYSCVYDEDYNLEPISLTMPTNQKNYYFNNFPPFFEGLLPEGIMLEGLLKINKLDAKDYFSQLVAVGNDMVGAVTVQLIDNE